MIKAALSNIRYIIWDFDGTFYLPNQMLWRDIREAEYRTISEYTGWDRDRVIREFNILHRRVVPSATETVARICGIATGQATVDFERYFDRRKYLQRDGKLISLFAKLAGFTHYILANGGIRGITESLEVLGITPSVFAQIVTSETVGVTKPDPKGFYYIMSQTKAAPKRHLMVGDRIQIDLDPAHEIGMRTCLVHAQAAAPDAADIILPSVYDLDKVLLKN